jgi:RNA polymerase sigma factor (sigma-70 family)
MLTEKLHILIERYVPLAKSEARKMSNRTPLCVTYEELESAAYEGLCLAANKCKNESTFGAYARFRIRGCMLDYLRSLRWTSRQDVQIASIDAISEDSNSGEMAEDSQRNTEEFFRMTTESLNAIGQQVVPSVKIPML